MSKYWFLCSLALLLGACGSASGPQRMAAAGNWQVMVSDKGSDHELCYTGAEPVKSQGTITAREGTPYLIVTKRGTGKMEISASSGYRYMGAGKIELVIDNTAYTLFHKDMTAWARTDRDDAIILRALKSAESVEVRGVSRQGMTSVDFYSAKGFSDAIEQVRKLCP